VTTPTPEDDIRTLLRHEVADIRASADLDARVRRSARRRLRLRACLVGASALLAVGCVLLTGLPAGDGSGGETTVQAAGALTCPAKAAPLRPTGRAGTDRVLVPGTPTAAVACTYDGGNAEPATLARGRKPIPLTGAALTRVIAALDQPVHPYAFRCLSDARSLVLMLRFVYPSGPPLVVEVHRVCPMLTNGTVSGAFNHQGTLPGAVTALFPES
jgi:hypothetical protein